MVSHERNSFERGSPLLPLPCADLRKPAAPSSPFSIRVLGMSSDAEPRASQLPTVGFRRPEPVAGLSARFRYATPLGAIQTSSRSAGQFVVWSPSHDPANYPILGFPCLGPSFCAAWGGSTI
jgi:hypothetical protein